MPDGGVMVRIPEDTGAALDALSAKMGRTPEALAAEAITDYVAREMRTLDAIERGMADARAGRVTPHEEVMREVWDIVGKAPAEP